MPLPKTYSLFTIHYSLFTKNVGEGHCPSRNVGSPARLGLPSQIGFRAATSRPYDYLFTFHYSLFTKT